ncbi:MAG: hypothetical protein JWO15_3267 [Sphingomonadales bacterium]|nr:hypothetical protein [Sphingomonadales bacterium]
MTKFLIGAAALALLSANPASAQLLGGGGLGGSMGGGGMLGGGMGGAGGMLGGAGSLGGTFGSGIGRMPDTVTDTTGRTSNSARADKSVNRRTGHVSATGNGSTDSALANTNSVAGRSVGGSGAASASGSGALDAQLIGTDTVRSVGNMAAGKADSTAQQTRETSKSATPAAKSNPGGITGNGAMTGAGTLSGGPKMLTLAGNGAGSFDALPGMNVNDAKGRFIGTVSKFESTSTGRVEKVVMKVGNRTASLPASNFTGSGDVLVSTMPKKDVTTEAKKQDAKK